MTSAPCRACGKLLLLMSKPLLPPTCADCKRKEKEARRGPQAQRNN